MQSIVLSTRASLSNKSKAIIKNRSLNELPKIHSYCKELPHKTSKNSFDLKQRRRVEISSQCSIEAEFLDSKCPKYFILRKIREETDLEQLTFKYMKKAHKLSELSLQIKMEREGYFQ